MSLWILIVLLATVIKLPIAGLMLWIPFRDDAAMQVPPEPDSNDEDGGSKTLPGGTSNPHPRRPTPRLPRRGPHGSPAPPAPRRVRTTVAAVSRRRVHISH
jgi:hypothetical protein